MAVLENAESSTQFNPPPPLHPLGSILNFPSTTVVGNMDFLRPIYHNCFAIFVL